MQAGSAARRGVSTIPRRRRLNVLLTIAAVLVVAVVVALAVWMVPLTTTEVGTDAAPKAGGGSAVLHDDAGNVRPGAVSAIVHDDAGIMPLSAGSAVIHDDAGNMPR